jgi:hypothetical protein
MSICFCEKGDKTLLSVKYYVKDSSTFNLPLSILEVINHETRLYFNTNFITHNVIKQY